MAGVLLATVLLTTPAHAHLMPAQQGTINVKDSAVFGVFSIPVTALHHWDDDHNGRMSDGELAAHYDDVVRQLTSGIQVRAGDDPGVRALLVPSLDVDRSAAPVPTGASHLIVLMRQSFTRIPQQVEVGLTLFGSGADEREFLVKGTVNGTAPEVAILRRGTVAHRFFAPAIGFRRMPQRPGMPLLAGLAIVVLCSSVLTHRWRALRPRAGGARIPV
jgi:hypothetical protein